uniref:uncharacterized protein LOC122588554 n=1 Tax=Erigeron canadensis TaxID=72917 RepID=UPI001CB8BB92|nr:uncharacterized protein LOC122588554 [Erigeron canadensis]
MYLSKHRLLFFSFFGSIGNIMSDEWHNENISTLNVIAILEATQSTNQQQQNRDILCSNVHQAASNLTSSFSPSFISVTRKNVSLNSSHRPDGFYEVKNTIGA